MIFMRERKADICQKSARFLGREKEIDLLQVTAAIVAGDAQRFIAQESDGGIVGKRVPGVLNGLEFCCWDRGP